MIMCSDILISNPIEELVFVPPTCASPRKLFSLCGALYAVCRRIDQVEKLSTAFWLPFQDVSLFCCF